MWVPADLRRLGECMFLATECSLFLRPCSDEGRAANCGTKQQQQHQSINPIQSKERTLSAERALTKRETRDRCVDAIRWRNGREPTTESTKIDSIIDQTSDLPAAAVVAVVVAAAAAAAAVAAAAAAVAAAGSAGGGG